MCVVWFHLKEDDKKGFIVTGEVPILVFLVRLSLRQVSLLRSSMTRFQRMVREAPFFNLLLLKSCQAGHTFRRLGRGGVGCPHDLFLPLSGGSTGDQSSAILSTLLDCFSGWDLTCTALSMFIS